MKISTSYHLELSDDEFAILINILSHAQRLIHDSPTYDVIPGVFKEDVPTVNHMHSTVIESRAAE